MLSYAASAAAAVVLNTLDPTGVIRGAAGALGTLGLAAAVDPAVQQAYDDLGWVGKLYFNLSSGADAWGQNEALNQQKKAANDPLRAGSIGTVLGGSQFSNAGKAQAEIKKFARDTGKDIGIEAATAGAGGLFGKGDDINDLRKAKGKFQKARKGAKSVGTVLEVGASTAKLTLKDGVLHVSEIYLQGGDSMLSILDRIRNIAIASGAKSIKAHAVEFLDYDLRDRLKTMGFVFEKIGDGPFGEIWDITYKL